MRELITTFSLLLVCLHSLSADEIPKSPGDVEIRQKIVGIWIIDVETTDKTYSAKGTVTYSSNDCYVAEATVVNNGKTHKEKFEGTWKVENGILTDTITNAVGIGDGTPPKNFEVAKVIHVDENELILQAGKKTKFFETEKRKK